MQNALEYSGDLKEIPKIQHLPVSKPLARYSKIYEVAHLSSSYTMKSIGDKFGVHYATVSRAVSIMKIAKMKIDVLMRNLTRCVSIEKDYTKN